MGLNVFYSWMMPYHVRTFHNVPYQQCFFYMVGNTEVGIQDGKAYLGVQHFTSVMHEIPHNREKGLARFSYKFMNPPRKTQVLFIEAMLMDEVKKKLYFIHLSPDIETNFVIQETSVEIDKIFDNEMRTVTVSHATRLFLGHIDLPPSGENISVHSFLNQFDGSIFQVYTVRRNLLEGQGLLEPTSTQTLSWVRLDDHMKVSNDSGTKYAGQVKVMSECEVEFPRLNGMDVHECGILFSKDGKKLVMRFRLKNPEEYEYKDLDGENIKMKEHITSLDSLYPHEMAKSPTYAVFGLDYDSHKVQLLTKFIPNSQLTTTQQENHANLLISDQLSQRFADGIGFPNSKARSYLSQRSLMIGQYLKYTFFSTNNGVIGVTAVKSFMKTLQSGDLSLTPKKVWFPLEDERVKAAFKSLNDNNPIARFIPSKLVKWEMVAQKNNTLLVARDEFILEIFHPDVKSNANDLLGTIRVKLGAEYKDYRECAGCGKIEQHKRRSKNGKRISQFKVCGWCKDHNVHKMWWEIPCHYCSEKCADSHWLVHQSEHSKVEKAKGKKKNKE